MSDPAADYMREAYLGLQAGGIDPETMTEKEWTMFRFDCDNAIRSYARGWAIAAQVLRDQEAAAMREP